MATTKKPVTKSSTRSKTGGGIKVSTDQYPLISFSDVHVPERNEDQLFFNPRFEESFNPVKLAELEMKIRIDTLQSPLIVRSMGKKGKIDSIQLIAGERRYRTIASIIENDRPCYDKRVEAPAKFRPNSIVIHRNVFGKVLSHKGDTVELQVFEDNQLTNRKMEVQAKDLLPTVSGKKLYAKVPCTIYHNCSDEKALGLAFAENEQHQSLRTCEEVKLVERLVSRELKQGEIADILGTNPTWVSQTLNFRADLPNKAFGKLMDGTMARNVAVAIMGFKEEDREILYSQMLVAEQEETAAQRKKAEGELIEHEDAEEIAISIKKQAQSKSDSKTVKAADKKIVSAQKQQAKAREKIDRVEAEAGHIKQSHVEKGSIKAGVLPKKARMLTKDQVTEFYVDGMNEMLDVDSEDYDSIVLIRNTARAILRGERDPLKILTMVDEDDVKKPVSRSVKSSNDDYDLDDDDDYDDYDDESAVIDDELVGMDIYDDDDEY